LNLYLIIKLNLKMSSSSNKGISFDELKASFDHYEGHIFVPEFNKYKKNKEESVTYIPLKFREVNGKLRVLYYNFKELVVGSAPNYFTKKSTNDKGGKGDKSDKKSKNDKDDDKNKNKFYITIYELTDEILNNTRYNESTFSRLKENNEKFRKAMDMIEIGYFNAVNVLNNIDDDTMKSRLGNDSDKEIQIHTIVQRERKLTLEELEENRKSKSDKKEKSKKVMLEKPLYRIKIPVDIKTKRIARANMDGTLRPIFNYSQEIEPKKFVILPLKYVDSEKNSYHLTTKNIKDTITSFSIYSGDINVDSIIISTYGYSLQCGLNSVLIKLHKPKKNCIDLSTYAEGMNEFAMNESESEDEVPIDEPKSTSKSTSKLNHTSKKSKYDLGDDNKKSKHNKRAAAISDDSDDNKSDDGTNSNNSDNDSIIKLKSKPSKSKPSKSSKSNKKDSDNDDNNSDDNKSNDSDNDSIIQLKSKSSKSKSSKSSKSNKKDSDNDDNKSNDSDNDSKSKSKSSKSKSSKSKSSKSLKSNKKDSDNDDNISDDNKSDDSDNDSKSKSKSSKSKSSKSLKSNKKDSDNDDNISDDNKSNNKSDNNLDDASSIKSNDD